MSLDGLTVASAKWLTATATITRDAATGPGVFDPVTGTHTPDPADPVHQGPCKMVPSGGDRVVDVGDGPVTLRTYDVWLAGPVDGIRVDDVVTISGSRDPALEGAVLRVLDVPGSTVLTNRRLVCEQRL